MSKRKGTDIFIELANLCSKDKMCGDFHFVWIGYINDDEKILSNYRLPSNTTIIPHTEKIYSYLKHIDCISLRKI